MAEHSPPERTRSAVIGPGFEIAGEQELGFLKVQTRGEEAKERLAQRLGLDFPPPKRWQEGVLVQCAWLAPGEWLLSGGEGTILDLASELTEMLAEDFALVTDVSHGRASFLLTGMAAADRIASACPLDLREPSFPPGCCARSLFGEATILLARLPDRKMKPAFRLVVDQSMAAYVLRLLQEPASR